MVSMNDRIGEGTDSFTAGRMAERVRITQLLLKRKIPSGASIDPDPTASVKINQYVDNLIEYLGLADMVP